MAKKKENKLEKYRKLAQDFTVGAAVLGGLVWIISGTFEQESHVVESLGNILIAATVVGGIVMGLLYSAKSK